MTSRTSKFLLLAGVVVLGACAALIPNEYLISQERLSGKFRTTFPLHRDLNNGFFSATLSVPEVGFLVAQNRISLAANFTASSLMTSSLQGRFVLTSALRYDRNQRALFLQDAHLDAMQIEQNDAYAEMLRPALNMMLGEYLKENPLYRFQPDELRFAGTEVDITGIEVVERGIKLKLTPMSPAH